MAIGFSPAPTFTTAPTGQSQGSPWGTWCSATTVQVTSNAAWVSWAGIPSGATMQQTTTSANTAGTSNAAWVQWVSPVVGTGSQLTATVWAGWVQATSAYNPLAQGAYTPPTQEQIAEQERINALAVEAAAKREETQKQAKERALKLLMDNLTEQQIKNFEENRCIDIEGKSGDRYKISVGRTRNIQVFGKDGQTKYHLCAHPDLNVPDEDTVLAQKLMIQTDEEAFLRIANRS